jgi:PqqA peptide cyclase
MQQPCATCPLRNEDFGGCRCQAFALTADAAATDRVCHLSPNHVQIEALAAQDNKKDYIYRHM